MQQQRLGLRLEILMVVSTSFFQVPKVAPDLFFDLPHSLLVYADDRIDVVYY